jgi:hypothetical protein
VTLRKWAMDLARRILVFADGETWEAGESGVLNDLHGVADGSGRFVAVGEGEVVLISSFHNQIHAGSDNQQRPQD